MILKNITYTNFNLPFNNSFTTSNNSYQSRSGFILKIEDEKGNIAFGEASPLVGFGLDSPNNAEKSLEYVSENLVQTVLKDNYESILKFSESSKLSSTVHFALDQCLINLLFIRNSRELQKIFPARKLNIRANFVIGFFPLEVILSRIASAKNKGFKTFKIKVGRDSIEDDIKIVSSIRNTFGSSIKIRLDANAKWNLFEAERIIKEFEQFDIEYIEQPVERIDEIMKLAENTSVSIAPDECIKSFDDAKIFFSNDRIRFLVLKPSLLGSIFNTLNLIKEAAGHNKIVIISSALETVVGRSAVNFIASLCQHKYPHGLATGDFFDSDLADDFYIVNNGEIDISKYPPEFKNVCG